MMQLKLGNLCHTQSVWSPLIIVAFGWIIKNGQPFMRCVVFEDLDVTDMAIYKAHHVFSIVKYQPGGWLMP